MAELLVTYDPEASAMYVQVSREPAARTDELVRDRVWVDRDAQGRVVGFEVIRIQAHDLPSAHHLEAQLRSAAEASDDDTLLALS